jgi:hypothetical protein
MNEQEHMQELAGIINEDDLITVPGVGKMRPDQLEKELDRKLKDLMKRAKSKSYETLSPANMEIMLQYWFSLAALNKDKPLPRTVSLDVK